MGGVLFERLDQVRRRVRRVLWLHGAAWLAVCIVGFLIVAGFIDWLVHSSSGMRLLFLGALMACAAWVIRKHLMQPLQAELTDLELALKVERENPELDPDLAAAVEFLKMPDDDPKSGSPALREHVVLRALAKSEPVDFLKVVHPRPARKMMGWAAGVAGVAAALALANPTDSAIALRRLANPFGGPAWPKRTRIELVQSAERIAIGDPFEVDVRLAGVVPNRVTIRYRFEGGETSSPELLREIQDRVFRGGMEAAAREFEFAIQAGDDETEWRPVKVVPAPEITSLVVKVDYPKYTRLQTETLPQGRGHVKAVVGSEVTVTARSNKPLESGELLLDEDGSCPAALSEDGLELTSRFTLIKDGHYQIVLRDREGMTNAKRTPARFRLEATPDRPPEIAIQKPAGDVDATPNAVVPVLALVKDDYGVGQVDLAHKPPVAASVSLENAGPETSRSLFKSNDSPRRQPVEYAWNLGPMGLKPGQVLSFHLSAADLRDLPPGPNVVKSREIRIRIVHKDELLKTMETDQQLVREELQRLLKLQETAMAQTADSQKQLEVDGRLKPQEVDKLQSADMLQRRVREKISDSDQSLQKEISRLLDQLRANQVQDVETDRRLKMMQSELARLSEQHLPPISQSMNNAIKMARGEEPTSTPASKSGNAGAIEDPRQGVGDRSKDSAGTGKTQSETPTTKNQARANQPGKSDDGAPADRKLSQADKSQAKEESQSGPSGRQSSRGSPTGDQPDSNAPAGKGASKKSSQRPDREAPENRPAARELAQARKHQQEVVDSLQQMLEQLDKWENIAQVATDARDLKRRQDEIRQQAEKLARETTGRTRENLSTDQKQQLAGAAAKQDEAADQMQRLERKIDRLSERSEKEDPSAAGALKEAMEQIRKSNLGEQMADAARDIDQNRLSDAKQRHEEIERSLDKLLNALEDRREQELVRLVKQLREAEDELAQLREEQRRLLQKTREAERIVDPEKRREELKRLAQRQQELQKKTTDFARRLSRLRADEASRRAERASSRMDRSGQQMQQGDSEQAGDQQEQADEQLADAQRELSQERRRREDELAREQLAKISDSIRQIYDRQLKVKEETVRLDELRKSKGSWTRGELQSLNALSRTQKGLQAESKDLTGKLTQAKVFVQVIEQAAARMGQASTLMEQREAGKPTQAAVESAANRFAQLLDALKPDPGVKPQQQQQQQQGEQEGGEGGGGGGQGGGIPDIAQIKLLKSLQIEINEQTQELVDARTRAGKWTEEQQKQFSLLSELQGRLATLALEISEPTGEPDFKEPQEQPK